MRKLKKPVDDKNVLYKAEEVFDTCISKVTDARLKARLQGVRLNVEQAAAAYDTAAAAAQLYMTARHTAVGAVTRAEMENVYTYRMVDTRQPGRVVYDRIMANAPNQRCPLCDIGTVSTLDHHLPKAHYPVLAVTPNNLVPSCTWCQTAKRADFSSTEEGQTLHPYYDDFNQATWLVAEVVQGRPAAFKYKVTTPANWSPVAKSRLESHVRTFKLEKLYGANASNEVVGIRSRLHDLFTSAGAGGVRDHLNEMADSWEEGARNSWQAAMYRAAAASDWFCMGGFLEE